MSDPRPIRDVKAVALVWSLPEEPEFLSFLQDAHGEYAVAPLSLQARRAAERFVPRERIVDAGALVTPAERGELYLRAIGQANALRRALLAGRAPWPACLEYDMTVPEIFYYPLYWGRVLQRLRESFPQARILHYGPHSMAAVGGFYTIQVEILGLLAGGTDVRQAGNPARDALRAAAGRVVNALPGLFARRTVESSGPESPQTCLVCGFQSADSVFQRGFVKRLAARGLKSLKWVVQKRFYSNLSADEQLASAPDAGLEPIACREETRDRFVWKSAAFGRLSETHNRGRLRAAMRRALGTGTAEPVVRALTDILLRRNANLRLRYHGIGDILRRFDPRVIVGFANYGDMIFAREWARRNGRRYIRFNGVEYVFEMDYLWDADRVGVLGEFWRRVPAQARPGLEKKLFLAGGLYWSEQALRARRPPASPESAGPWKVRFILSPNLLQDFPDSFAEMRGDFVGLSDALSARGGRLSIRLHPRMADRSSYRLLTEEVRRLRPEIEWADPQESLSAQMAESAAVLIRNWSGAAVFALYSDVPFVSWLPRPGNPGSDRIAQGLPLSARNAEELGALVDRVLHDPAFRSERLAAQRRFLEDQIADPFGDPYAQAVEVVLAECGAGR